MLLKEQMSLLHDARFCWKGVPDTATGSIGLRIRLVLTNKTEPDKNTQAIGIRSEQRICTREQQDLLGARLPNPGKKP